MDTINYEVKIKLVEDMLGTIPKTKSIYAEYIASKNPETADEEIATVADLDKLEAKGHTGFHADEEGNFLYDYSIKGFLCEAARTLKQFGAMKQLQDKFKRYVFVTPRRIRLPKIADEPLERPLRAMTAQGPRVTLARSDVIPAGTEISFNVEVLDVSGITEGCLREVLNYGKYMGLGQWRSGGWGKFEIVSLD